jgi:hypothetical protein
MNCNEANSIPIDMFLADLGIEPVKTRSHSKWYLSPLRSERTASFKVDTKINLWYDYGIGAGGNLVTLGTRLSNLSVSDFLSQMSTHKLSIMVNMQPPIEAPVSDWKIVKVKEISHPALVAYLKQRSVPLALANSFCSEVYYANDKQKYFAIGIKNDSDGYEVRNSVFKGCIGKKDITTLHKNPSRVAMFEGFIDFLSAHQLFDSVAKNTIVILNSVTQLPKAIQRLEIMSPWKIDCYFNNDDSGRNCTRSLRQEFPIARDFSASIIPFNDVNDFLRSRNAQNLTL